MFRRPSPSPSRPASRKTARRAATVVEMAVVLPVFAVFLAGLMEVNHAFLVTTTLRSAAEQGARSGVADGVTSAEVTARVQEILAPVIDVSAVTVSVKDGSVFDEADTDPNTVNYGALPDLQTATAEARQLYIVRVECDYSTVSLLPPFFLGGVTLVEQSVCRHE